MADAINEAVGQPKCVRNHGKCFFEEPCDRIPEIGNLKVSLHDNLNQFEMELDRSTMLIDGDKMIPTIKPKY